ncbi:TPA: fimbrial protein [Shigella sonnei]|nr:fimbrial protein [Shigella sonnei]HCV4006026.1 fimbrial protein [Shigella sonnei]
MKKTLIALAVAASAAVSGSAMAWTANGIGGSVSLGGQLTPQDNVTPWEVKVGDSVANLNAPIKKGQNKVSINVVNTIPVLGIRTVQKTPFVADVGITPQIDYGTAVDVDAFNASKAPLKLDVKDKNDQKIGVLTSNITVGSMVSLASSLSYDNGPVSAENIGDIFLGGVPKSGNKVLGDRGLADKIIADISANYTDQGRAETSPEPVNIPSHKGAKISGYYASGLMSGESIAITLDAPVQGNDVINWKATLPVVVSYQ